MGFGSSGPTALFVCAGAQNYFGNRSMIARIVIGVPAVPVTAPRLGVSSLDGLAAGPDMDRRPFSRDCRYFDRCITGFSTGFMASLRLWAVLISAMWVKACGKFPI
jgi:hypothetical protein